MAGTSNRFDGESTRRILQRAAVEQHRLESERADSYSFEELEEMAAEAGISSSALVSAVEADRGYPRTGSSRMATPSDVAARGWHAAVLGAMPDRWSPSTRRIVLACAGGIALYGVLLLFPVIAQALFWGSLIGLVVLMLGVSPS